MVKQRAYNVLGNLAIVNFSDGFGKVGRQSRTSKNFHESKMSRKSLLEAKKRFANKILKDHPSVKTILEKSGKFAGRLRKMQTKYIAGEKTKEVLYRENGCVFRFNIDTSYFSPRLSNERKEIASKIKKNENVLVMFAGVAPFSIVIAKQSKAKRVVSNELNREANKYAKLNVELNKLKEKVEIVGGDVKKVVGKIKESFDVIVMPRPQLKDTFLESAFKVSKKGTRIYYYDFCRIEDVDLIVEKIKADAKKAKKKIKILKTKSAGEIAPYKIRVRVDFKVL